MSETSNYLWNRILGVHQEIKNSEDAYIKWQKQMLLKVLVKQLKEEMGEIAYLNLLESSRHLLGLNSPQPEGQILKKKELKLTPDPNESLGLFFDI